MTKIFRKITSPNCKKTLGRLSPKKPALIHHQAFLMRKQAQFVALDTFTDIV